MEKVWYRVLMRYNLLMVEVLCKYDFHEYVFGWSESSNRHHIKHCCSQFYQEVKWLYQKVLGC